jgi:hypothetical protein
MKMVRIRNSNAKFVIIMYSIFFLFSLFIHNHPLSAYENVQYENDSPALHVKFNHNSEFCSACRADGKTHFANEVIRFGLDFHTTYFINSEQSFKNFGYLLKKTRAPPYFS